VYELDKKELQYWINRYAETEQPGEKEIEENLTKKFQQQGFTTQDDLRGLLKWKFGMMPGRMKRELNLIEQTPDEKIKETTRKAFQSENDKEKIKLLTSIKGIGNAVCSVVLTFHNPKKYGVFDIHAGEELLGKDVKNSQRTKDLITFFEELRKISKETGLTCREVEKALFTKNYIESKGNKSDKSY